MTIFTSQFLFGPTSVELKDKIWYRQCCIKIGRRYFKLSSWLLVPFILYNLVTIAVLLIFAIKFVVLQETYICDARHDCFIDDENNHTKITDCSEYKGINVVCYMVEFRPAFVISLLGGFLKIVPPLVFKLTTGFYLNLLRYQKWWLKVIMHILQSILAITFFTFLASINVFGGEKGSFQVIATFSIVMVFSSFPWYIIDIGRFKEDVLMEASVKTFDCHND